MTQDEIIRMARDAGFFEFNIEGWINEFERFTALVAAHEREKPTTEALRQAYIAGMRAEREACAKMCEEIGGSIYVSGRSQGADFCAAAIRARGNNK